MPCAWYDDFGYIVVACVPDLRMTNTPDWTDDSVSDTRLVSITFFKQVSNFH